MEALFKRFQELDFWKMEIHTPTMYERASENHTPSKREMIHISTHPFMRLSTHNSHTCIISHFRKLHHHHHKFIFLLGAYTILYTIPMHAHFKITQNNKSMTYYSHSHQKQTL
mmetsp:Transcript_37622/g.55105  ORF Transcript_37622/g.55105 Transcript_37622/m.55105 type:complete len:113 (-) Transcript_37622:1360-1698(-)